MSANLINFRMGAPFVIAGCLLAILITMLYSYLKVFGCDVEQMFSDKWTCFAQNSDAWGQFGDFIGGILNPSLSLLVLVVAYRTYSSQKEASAKEAEVLNFQKFLDATKKIIEQLERVLTTKSEPKEYRFVEMQSEIKTLQECLEGFYQHFEESISIRMDVAGNATTSTRIKMSTVHFEKLFLKLVDCLYVYSLFCKALGIDQLTYGSQIYSTFGSRTSISSAIILCRYKTVKTRKANTKSERLQKLINVEEILFGTLASINPEHFTELKCRLERLEFNLLKPK